MKNHSGLVQASMYNSEMMDCRSADALKLPHVCGEVGKPTAPKESSRQTSPLDLYNVKTATII